MFDQAPTGTSLAVNLILTSLIELCIKNDTLVREHTHDCRRWLQAQAIYDIPL
jgi:hypothetical protein